MNIYNVYDIKNNEQFVMSGTARQLARKLNTRPKTIREYAKLGFLVQKRYKIILDMIASSRLTDDIDNNNTAF